MADYQHISVKVYHGFGHKQNLTVYGHVYENKNNQARDFAASTWAHMKYLVRLFCVKPVANATVRLTWGSQVFTERTEKDGLFRFEWASDTDVPAGWHKVTINFLDSSGDIVQSGLGSIFVPHITQYAFISDIDDTVMISYSATVFKRMQVLLTKIPRTRKVFESVVAHYKLLALAHTSADIPNPFFYVSSSEWNLYDDLNEFFNHNGLPPGVFLLSQIKRWYQLFKTGKTKHEGKLLRVYRILDAFPSQRFILLGDNSQADPVIYQAICEKHPEKVLAVYIRNIYSKKSTATREVLSQIAKQGIATCLFDNSQEAIEHSRQIGLIS